MTKLIIYYTEVNNWKWYFLRMQQVTQKINGTKIIKSAIIIIDEFVQ